MPKTIIRGKQSGATGSARSRGSSSESVRKSGTGAGKHKDCEGMQRKGAHLQSQRRSEDADVLRPRGAPTKENLPSKSEVFNFLEPVTAAEVPTD